MDDVAAMLNTVAGGLQQSFGTVFERVGQSLEQSAQMMQMMNAMMEAAMLQHLVVHCDVQAATADSTRAALFTLRLTVENRSQINITEAVLRVQLGGSTAVVDADATATTTDAGADDRVIEGGLEAKSSVELRVPLHQGMLGHEGAVLLRVRSPGTHEWLQKDVPFRIPLLKMARVEAVASVFSGMDGLVQETSDSVQVQLLREALGVSAFDALLTTATGYYRLVVPAGVLASNDVQFAVQIQQTAESPNGARVIVAAAPTDGTSDIEESQRTCHLIIEELESLKA